MQGTSLVVQWLRVFAPNAGHPGSIPGQGTRSYMLQLEVWHNQINKNKHLIQGMKTQYSKK